MLEPLGEAMLPSMQVGDVLYRATARLRVSIDGGRRPELVMTPWRVVRMTAHSAWLVDTTALPGSGEQLMRLTAKRRFAYPTELAAWEDLRRRTRHRLRITRCQYDDAVAVARLLRLPVVAPSPQLGLLSEL